MDSEEVKKHKEEKEKVKKMLGEYKQKVNKEMEKHVEELEKDEKLKEVLREIEEAQAKHPGEKRKASKSITEINEKHWDELYQGDIELSVEQAQYLLDTNPDTCTTCICPHAYIGAKCQEVDIGGYAPAGITNTCEGNILFATPNWQNINGQIGSSDFDSKIDYAYCHWQIFPDIGKTILIEVLGVGVVCGDGCIWGNTEIRTAANRGATGVRLCCRSDLGSSGKLTITATNGYALISLYSFSNIQRFHIRFRQY
ncbi:hypothetical protein niasHS_009982 [Heterodera schachtii]|uniref:CUB domain-containing protein n=1 Tax=Heterodera schachtii TaxID=97005 RepID=A0ABD2JD37_HETSC